MKILTNLLSIKSLVTLLLSVTFCVLAFKGVINTESIMTVYTMVIGFYFGTQFEKKRGITKNESKS